MFSPASTAQIPTMVSMFTYGWGFVDESVSASDPASAAPETGGLAVYYPVQIPKVCVARRLWWANGATTTGGATIEVGIYQSAQFLPATKLVSGSATQGTASQVQFVDITDSVLTPGLIWLAIMASTTTNTTLFRATVGNAAYEAPFRFQQSSANPLPSSATPAESSGQNIYLFGFSTTTIT